MADADARVESAATTSPKRRRRAKAPSCADCFFGVNRLCALGLSEPCPTFRPDTPAGLVPPRQPALLMRQGAPRPAADAWYRAA